MSLSAAKREEIMQQRLRELTMRGYRVEAVDGARAVVVTGAPVNHILHLLLAVLTCGLWLPVWLLIVVLGGEKRRHLWIDDYGNLMGIPPTVITPAAPPAP